MQAVDDIKPCFPLFGDDDYQASLKNKQELFEERHSPEKVQPDLVGSGIKEKYVFQKMGVPFRQMHSWDYSGPYHGYDGFAIFARDMDMAISSPIWQLAKTAPWKC